MPAAINHWWTTRPKRKLILLPETLRVFAAVAEGHVWRKNLRLHLEFESELERRGIKRIGARRDQRAGGGRTYAAWLYSFGLWFETDDGLVHLTLAGEDLVKGGNNPVTILTKQLLDFQYPSPFSIDTKVNPRFRIFPFRFLIKLLIDPRLEGRITKDEIAFCVLPFAESEASYEDVVVRIQRHRSGFNFKSAELGKFESTFGAISKIKDTANTFINQLEYTQLIERHGRIDDAMVIISGKTEEIKELISVKKDLQTRVTEREHFQRYYGLGPFRKRDNRTFEIGSTVTSLISARSQVMLAYLNVVAHTPTSVVTDDMANRIAEMAGLPRHQAELIIEQLGIVPRLDEFEQRYLFYSTEGTEYCDEFEQATEGILGKYGLGFTTEWIGPKPNNPDVLAISANMENRFIGIIDAKAYIKYTINGNHSRTMQYVYIDKFKSFYRNGNAYDLAFFTYVANGFGTSINGGINHLYSSTGIKGSAVGAKTILNLLAEHRKKNYSMEKLKSIFQVNRLLIQSDFTL